MSLGDWLTETGRRITRGDLRAVTDSLHALYTGSWRITGSRLPLGTNVYGRDWETLIVLDACRVDTLRRVADEYGFLGPVDSIRSVGSTSREWLAKTFTPNYAAAVSNTVYVTANPYTEEILGDGTPEARSPFNPASRRTVPSGGFARIEEVWRDRWSERLGTVPPRAVTEAALAASNGDNRVVVHYMQPHQPFLAAGAESATWVDENPWAALSRGEADLEAVRADYTRNLRVVLEEVRVLLSGLETDRAVVTADHGNAFGEWGIYGHPNGFLHPSVKRVPWVETTIPEAGDDSPVDRQHKETGPDAGGVTVDDRLNDLGYL